MPNLVLPNDAVSNEAPVKLVPQATGMPIGVLSNAPHSAGHPCRSHPHALTSPIVNNWVLALNIVNTPLLLAVDALAIAACLILLVRRPTRRWMLVAACGIVGGAAIGALTLLVTVTWLDLFGTRLPPRADATVILTFAGLGLGLVSLVPRRRRPLPASPADSADTSADRMAAVDRPQRTPAVGGSDDLDSSTPGSGTPDSGTPGSGPNNAAARESGTPGIHRRAARWVRPIVALVTIGLLIVAGTLNVNAIYGLNKTVAAFFGVTNEKPLVLPEPGAGTGAGTATGGGTGTSAGGGAASTLPATGEVGTIDLPHDASGFIARTALAYVPPAGLVPNPPPLPVIIQLNGQPGSPGLDDPKAILDQLAAAHNGVAPIVINPDQLGDDSRDPLCLDTNRGNVETYIMKDVVPWVKAHFSVLQDPKDWTIMGFSNGGMCAAYFGAKYPATFGNFVDISGDEYQGVDDKGTLQSAFGGNQAAYEAVWPFNVMAHGSYPDSSAVFAVGAADDQAIPGVKRNFDAAVAAGIHATYTEIAGSAHDNTALDGGLTAGYALVYSRAGIT